MRNKKISAGVSTSDVPVDPKDLPLTNIMHFFFPRKKIGRMKPTHYIAMARKSVSVSVLPEGSALMLLVKGNPY